jgi:hypothetical protein
MDCEVAKNAADNSTGCMSYPLKISSTISDMLLLSGDCETYSGGASVRT